MTSVPFGNSETATVVRDCAEVSSPSIHSPRLESSTHRHRLLEESIIRLIHNAKILVVRHVNVDLDRVLQVRPSSFKDGGKVAKDLCL